VCTRMNCSPSIQCFIYPAVEQKTVRFSDTTILNDLDVYAKG